MDVKRQVLVLLVKEKDLVSKTYQLRKQSWDNERCSEDSKFTLPCPFRLCLSNCDSGESSFHRPCGLPKPKLAETK
jgi:hypothetical protein